MVKAGVIDAAKVTGLALQNAAPIAGLMLTTEALVAGVKEEKEEVCSRRRSSRPRRATNVTNASRASPITNHY
jgi:chaperonin GroEL (HSP60 family)